MDQVIERHSACGRGGKHSTAPSCAPEGYPGYCENLATIPPYKLGNASCTGEVVPCCRGADLTPLLPWFEKGSQARLNYWAAFEVSNPHLLAPHSPHLLLT